MISRSPCSAREQNLGITAASPDGRCRGPYTFASRSTAWQVPCSRLSMQMYCSAQYFAAPYGDSGIGGTLSGDGMGASCPYKAPPLEQNSTRAPALRAASSTLIVPITFTYASSTGNSVET